MSLFFRQTVPSEQRHRDVRVNGLFTFLKFTGFRERKGGRGGERERERERISDLLFHLHPLVDF